MKQGLEVGLVNWHLAGLHGLDLGLVDVHTNDGVSGFGQAGARHESHVSCSDYGNVHVLIG